MANVLLGVCGGIAAYKACEVVRLLKKAGHDVQVILTPSAQKFVTPLTFESLSQRRAHVDLFDDEEFGTAHISLARWADRFLIAPATADVIARLAQGRSSDLLSTVALAFRGKLTLAPSMNTAMWEHPLTRENLDKLKSLGANVIQPEQGDLACGETGEGKLASPPVIVDALFSDLARSPLLGKRAVVTLGPTREYLDAVRFISSPSTGKMGLAIARALAERGARVTIIHGPLAIDAVGPFEGSHAVTSAEQMLQASLREADCDVFVSCASVSDFAPVTVSDRKEKKADAPMTLTMAPTPDIAATIGAKKRPGQILVGFAAETRDHEVDARDKLKRKNLDLIVANPVYREERGFAQDETSVTFYTRDAHEAFENVSKASVARILCEKIESMLAPGTIR